MGLRGIRSRRSRSLRGRTRKRRRVPRPVRPDAASRGRRTARRDRLSVQEQALAPRIRVRSRGGLSRPRLCGLTLASPHLAHPARKPAVASGGRTRRNDRRPRRRVALRSASRLCHGQPTAMNEREFRALIDRGMDGVAAWESRWPAFETDPALGVPFEQAAAAIDELAVRLRDNYPFFHPCYAGQMLKPPHPVALAAYAMTARINPNNHALDGGPATAALECEAVAQIATMFGYDGDHLGHLTSSGTFANLEALWVASRLKPGTAVAHSAEAHYTHARMCDVLGVPSIS